MGRLYVEVLVRAPMNTVWDHTQQPAAHARWDGRFSRIEYLAGTLPQRFRYATAGVAGVGVTAGERLRPDGTRTSALRFSSDHPLSPIKAGSGYWQYVPTPDGVRFLTGYDYRPGWGRSADRIVRPLLGWLTAWSFDRLRLWLERGISPERSRNQALAEVALRAGAVLAVARLGGTLAMPAAALLLALPPLPGTPAARRCLRRPPDRASLTAPSTLASLAQPR